MKFHLDGAPGAVATRLWVMLPGAYMKPGDFIEAGFVEALRRRGLPHDVALLDAHVGEVADGSALTFLDAFLRAEAAGAARRVGLFGISLGAHLALAWLARCQGGGARPAPGGVASACLLAPYLGPREVAAEIAAAGGLRAWRPAPPAHNDIDRCIWQWLQRQAGSGCDLYLGYGSEDRFARAQALMAQALPPHQVDVQPGGHDWPVWAALWHRYLDSTYGHA